MCGERHNVCSNLTLGLLWSSACYQPHKPYTLWLRGLFSLQEQRASTCFILQKALSYEWFKCCPSNERILSFCVVLNVPFLQIKAGGCLVCLLFISVRAAPPSSQEGRKSQSVAVFPAIQLLSSPHDLDQEVIGKEGGTQLQKSKRYFAVGQPLCGCICCRSRWGGTSPGAPAVHSILQSTPCATWCNAKGASAPNPLFWLVLRTYQSTAVSQWAAQQEGTVPSWIALKPRRGHFGAGSSCPSKIPLLCVT